MRWRILVGGRVFAAMKRSLGAGEWMRRGLGVAVLAAVAAIALGLDTGFLTRLSVASTTARSNRRLLESMATRLADDDVGRSATTGAMTARSGDDRRMLR